MLAKFYGDVLPRSGYFCLWTKHDKAHIWANSHEQLIAKTETRLDMPGVYFATASYQTTASREQVNVQALRSLRLDIDVAKPSDPTGTYPNKKVALAAVIDFFKSTALVPTYVVSSGKGFHIYWCMDADCEPSVWKPMAEGLQRAGGDFGLLIDRKVTTDSARILRPPGTIHHDDVRVQILQDTNYIWKVTDLQGKLVSVKADTLPIAPAGKYDTSINREAIIEVVRRPPVSAIAVAQKCNALRFAAERLGDIPEPYWRAMLGLVKHTIEGEDLAHEWSSGHPNYDEEETQKKLDGWTAGPTTCLEFANHTSACQTCVFRGTVRSPVLLVDPPAPAAVAATPQPASHPEPTRPARIVNAKPWEGHLPEGYTVETAADGKTHTLVTFERTDDESPDGQPVVKKVKITHNIWWLGQWAGADNSDEKAQLTLNLFEHGHVKTYTLEQNILAALPEFKKQLADKSIHPLPGRKASQAMQDYGLHALQLIHHQGKRLQISDHLGLRILPNGDLIATQGEYTIYPDSHIEHSMIGGNLTHVARQFGIPLPETSAGNEWGPEVWQHIEPFAQQHIAFLQKHYGGPGMERLQVAIMMGLASPFMPFVEGKFQSGSTLPRVGLSVSLFSRASGAGKTTAVAAAIAAYGNPADLTNDGGSLGSTEKARSARLTAHGTLPNIMDEMGSNIPAAVASAVSMVANGAPRERATREGGLSIAAPWALINLMTTNTSQRDMIAAVQESSDAIQQRLLEINVDDMPEFDLAMRSQFSYDWMGVQQKCVGALGAMIHREICKMGVAGVTALTLACVAKADQRLGGKQGSRFQYRGLGAMFALYMVLKQIGIEIFPMKGVLEAFKVAHDSGQEFIVENTMPTNGLEILARALHELKPQIIVTTNETKRTRHTPHAVDVMLNDRMPDPVYGRHIVTTGRTYLVQNALRAWCSKHGLTEHEIIKEAKKDEVLIPWGARNLPAEKFNIYKGMRTDTDGQVSCYCIDTQKLARKLGQEPSDIVAPVVSNVVPLRQ